MAGNWSLLGLILWRVVSRLAKRLRVYISGPYSKGDVMANIRRALDAAEEVWRAGHLPYVPHLTGFWHMVHPHPWREWLEYDLEWLRVCDVVLRLPGDSAGADTECYQAARRGMPVVHSVAELARIAEEARDGSTVPPQGN